MPESWMTQSTHIRIIYRRIGYRKINCNKYYVDCRAVMVEKCHCKANVIVLYGYGSSVWLVIQYWTGHVFDGYINNAGAVPSQQRERVSDMGSYFLDKTLVIVPWLPPYHCWLCQWNRMTAGVTVGVLLIKRGFDCQLLGIKSGVKFEITYYLMCVFLWNFRKEKGPLGHRY